MADTGTTAGTTGTPGKRKIPKGRHFSAIKAVRKSERQRKYNRNIKQKIKDIAKQVEEACRKKDTVQAKKILDQAFSLWDKAAKKRVIHPRKADRKKGRLARKVAQLISVAK